MRLRPADLAAFAEFNAGTIRARRAYAADAFAHLTPRRTCACGAYTRSDDGYIFTARDYWRGLWVALEHDAEEHVRTLYAHGVYKDHCGGYEVSAWPCFPASVTLTDLRALIGAKAWARVDPFGGHI